MAEEESCAYCLQQLANMVNPKQLPCGHSFCLVCLQEDSQSFRRTNGDTHVCVTCKQECNIVRFNDLPTPSRKKLPDKTSKLNCDRCEVPNAAVSYCVDCCDKICPQHIEHHNGYFGTSHTVVDMSLYESNRAEMSTVLVCEHHQQQVINMICKVCFQYNCVHCHQKNPTCESAACQNTPVRYTSARYSPAMQPGANYITERAPILSPQKISKLVKSHDYQPLEVMQEDLKRSLRGLMTNIAEKVDCIHKKEKKVSLIMDTVREQCRGMRKAIETQKNQQIKVIEDQAQQLITDVNCYEAAVTNELVHFAQQLDRDKSSLENERTAALEVCNSEIDTMVKQYTKIVNSLKAATNAKIPTYSPSKSDSKSIPLVELQIY